MVQVSHYPKNPSKFARLVTPNLKKIHKLVIGSFIGPFLMTFFISLFILIMQFLWLYIDDLMGKGLEWYIIAEFLLYACASLVNLALPMAVLLSSIMTFGNLAEQYELVAMKSSGLSLTRIMRSLLAFVIVLTIGAFLFANWISPVAFLKSRTLMWDITEKKPALELRPNVFFTGINGYSIRIKDKDQDKNILKDVLIYDQTDESGGNRRVIRAKWGRMSKSPDGRSLVMSLHEGSNYEELAPTPRVESKVPMMQNDFKQQDIRIDLSGMNLMRSDENLFKSGHKMLNINQLSYVEDSLVKSDNQYQKEYLDFQKKTYLITRDTVKRVVKATDSITVDEKVLEPMLLEMAANNLRGALSYTQRQIDDEKVRSEQLNRYIVEGHRKFTLSLACLLLFFIGAPLGAIIRKGGLGLPVVFAVVFFLLFHILSITGEKMAIAGIVPIWLGMWLNMFVMVPIAIFLTTKARNDSPLFERETYIKLLRKLSLLRKTSNENTTALP